MGIAFFKNLTRKATKPIKDFNIENRLQREIDRQQQIPKVAPRHKSTEQAYEQLATEHPEIMQELNKKNEKLLDNLKQLRVTSHGPPPELKSKGKLPQYMRHQKSPEFGFYEPEKIPEGRVTLRSALDFITQHSIDPSSVTVETIAKQYKIDRIQVQNVLTYFLTFRIHISEDLLKKYPKISKTLEQGKNANMTPLQKLLSSAQTKSMEVEDTSESKPEGGNPEPVKKS
ncbi:hypothetical protein CHS0354_010948 [Potamilus streckersoni]|uniref:NADH dehydrogenase [ubiquinone] 1 alpha subcomplex assembly factor 4 n=1 Tax=Potamilus streckersoni TaxID=2493646 RepID=A0AAE0W0B8_9BIVA|nr:hypothetical protein CHS0354_010948 [Potamilus streckersoni]